MNKTIVNKGQWLIVLIILLLGIVLAVWILSSGKADSDRQDEHGRHPHSHEEANTETPKGPHAGKWLKQDGLALEATIYEQGNAPVFRVYAYDGTQPLDPAKVQLTMEIQRLGQPVQILRLHAEQGYLTSDTEIVEPHSFEVKLLAQYAGKQYRFGYAQQEARVQFSDHQLAMNGIEILTAAPARIKANLKLIGEVRLNADRTVLIVPRLGGVVQSVAANAGDQVRKGQLLAIVSSQQLADQRSEMLAARERVALARITYEREKQLWEDKISAKQDYLQAKQSMQEQEIVLRSTQQKLAVLGINPVSNNHDLTSYEIRSPIDGVVTDKQIAVGQVLREDTNIYQVADLSTVWVEATVYARDLNLILPGQQVTVRSSALKQQAIGKVAYIQAQLGEQSRTAMARIVLPNANGQWRPGVPADIDLVTEEIEVPLAVSLEGLQTLRDWTVVFGRYGDLFEARPLKLGRSDDKYVEVLEGLSEGEQYAAKNSFLIKAELGKSSAVHDH
ncbi:efflux RND transporter periplasmic adaptor subunit [Methylobacillus gramineus]|uniref:efflux RND transporter periplasmic adaptor subunit n=1 Tax=Methylobacillus gramineus TaxID=755169 RepID=UPI001CFFCF23|nr:efflux RND transporter periplasmic adaptor subunit [Methylobacillus gramineus]MCB5185963.1 efflux RND transporter periplasmic adaptor subunit [Methylobacillus gramineus]